MICWAHWCAFGCLLLGTLMICWAHWWSAGHTDDLLSTLMICWAHWWSAEHTDDLLGTLMICWAHWWSAGHTDDLLSTLMICWAHLWSAGHTDMLQSMIELLFDVLLDTQMRFMALCCAVGHTGDLLGTLVCCWAHRWSADGKSLHVPSIWDWFDCFQIGKLKLEMQEVQLKSVKTEARCLEDLSERDEQMVNLKSELKLTEEKLYYAQQQVSDGSSFPPIHDWGFIFWNQVETQFSTRLQSNIFIDPWMSNEFLWDSFGIPSGFLRDSLRFLCSFLPKTYLFDLWICVSFLTIS